MKDLVKSLRLRKTWGMRNHTNCRCAESFQTAVRAHKHAHAHTHSLIHFLDVYLLVAAAWLSQALVEVGLQGFYESRSCVYVRVCVCLCSTTYDSAMQLHHLHKHVLQPLHAQQRGLQRLTFTLSFHFSHIHIHGNT